MVPIAAQVAGLDPLSAAKIEQAPILEITKPPGTLHNPVSYTHLTLPTNREV